MYAYTCIYTSICALALTAACATKRAWKHDLVQIGQEDGPIEHLSKTLAAIGSRLAPTTSTGATAVRYHSPEEKLSGDRVPCGMA